MALIKLSRGFEVLVDDDLYDALNKYRWHAVVTANNIYARRCTNYKYTYMHHQILGVSPIELRLSDMLVDHINRDSLDNTKANLRIVTREENVRNSTAFKNRGWVYFHKQSGKYCVVYKGLHLGQYKTQDEAHKAARSYNLEENNDT